MQKLVIIITILCSPFSAYAKTQLLDEGHDFFQSSSSFYSDCDFFAARNSINMTDMTTDKCDNIAHLKASQSNNIQAKADDAGQAKAAIATVASKLKADQIGSTAITIAENSIVHKKPLKKRRKNLQIHRYMYLSEAFKLSSGQDVVRMNAPITSTAK